MGRLVRDPEIRYSQGDSSMAIARYTLAVDRRMRRTQEGGGDNQQTADFIGCVAFGRSAEFAERYMHQGMRMLIEGRIQTGSYTNKDGQKVYTTDVIVENQEFADSKGAQAPGGNYQGQPQNQNRNYGNGGGYNNNYNNYGSGNNGAQQDNGMGGGSSISDGFMNIPDGVEDEGLPFN